jgi:atypical dual specificity phosphatase
MPEMETQSLLTAYLNFAWVWPIKLAGCRSPRSTGDISKLRELGIRAVVRLELFTVSTESLRSADIDDCPEPVGDYKAPTQDQIDRMVRFALRAMAQSKPTAASCGAGYGRTATLLACVLVACGRGVEEALQEVARSNSHRHPETAEQREAIHLFAQRLATDENLQRSLTSARPDLGR